MVWHTPRKKKESNNNRIAILLAVIFLFAVCIIIKLFNIQILEHELYAVKALGQHGVEKDILPMRGRIFVRTKEDGAGKSELYPLAANKEFALVYAVPKDIKEPEKTVETLAPVLYPLIYEEPDIELLLVKIEKNIREELALRAENDAEPGEEIVIDGQELQIALAKEKLVLEEQLKKEKEERMEEYQEELLEKLSKEFDPYEPLVKKVDPGHPNHEGGTSEGGASKKNLGEILALNIKGIEYFMSTYRYYPEKNIGSHILGYVIEDPEHLLTQGSYGVEGFFNKELAGQLGSLTAERDAMGKTIIVADREVNPAVDGSDIILTIDKTIQSVACHKLNTEVLRHGADSGSLIIMEPSSGKLIAMCAYPDFDPNEYGKTKKMEYFNNLAIFNAYEPGSIFKAMTMAAGLDLEKIEPSTTFNDTGSVTLATETIRNSDNKIYGQVTMTEVLEESINTGAIFVAQKIGINNFLKYVEDFGFGQKSGIGLMTEVKGNISALYDKKLGPTLNLATASFGQGILVTPLQMVTAYAAIANQGILVKPYIVDEVIRPDGEHIRTQPQEIRRVISPKAATLLSGMLVQVIEGGHAKRAGVDGYYVAGKTGTAQIADPYRRGYLKGKTNHTFVGFAPVDDPKFVMLTYLEDPKDVRYAASSAAPLFGEIVEFVLNYYQVEKERGD